MGDCGTFDIGCHLGTLAGSVLTLIATAFVEALTQAAVTITTLWIGVETPALATNDAGAPSETVAFIQNSLAFYTGLLLIIGMAIGLVKIALEHRRGRRADATRTLGTDLATFLLANNVYLAGIWLCVQAFDEFSPWIIDRAIAEGDFGTNLTAMLGFGGLQTGGMVVALVLIVAFFALLVSLYQVFLTIARGGMLVLSAGMLPTTAAFATTGAAGKAMHRKAVGWIAAWVLYKPVASIVYATGFRMAGADVYAGDGLATAMAGFIVLFMAVFVLHALIKFLVPVVAAMGSGSGTGTGDGGGGGGAVAAGASQVVSGFVSSGSPTSGGGASGSGPGAAGPTGASGLGGGPGPSGAGGGAGTAGGAGAAGAAGAGAAGPAGLAVQGGMALAQGARSASNSAIGSNGGQQ